MDPLSSAYMAQTRNPKTQPEPKPVYKPEHLAILLHSKRPKPSNPYTPINNSHHAYCSNSSSVLQREAPIAGRYVSKRERAILGSVSQVPVQNPDPNRDTPLSSSPGLCEAYTS
ncbi:WD repeat-containing protein 25 [Tripterygium wilfordii]|uniref:WD repeat-containing protein 25 n=1 Tax=Tripterygium wilfordii TaxID=458696 RepID=A0A7J7C3A9_TRIWF|nr:uncharacterized protein LOC119988668 [Tripterygium wilfordii]KAF5728347.1 WD repeat-containing protein 25 [Tripterygium wilfordii]